MGLPISLVKRIMCCDEDVQRVTSGAVRATARAAELFIQVRVTLQLRIKVPCFSTNRVYARSLGFH